MTVNIPKNLRFHISEILDNANKTFVLPMRHTPLNLLANPVFGGEQMIKIHLEQLFIELIRISSKSAFSTSRELMENRIVEECISYLKGNIYGNITIDELCKNTNCCRTRICSLFREITGKTVINYYNELKIQKAKRLIEKNTLSITEISDMLAFNTPNYFSHIFRKFTGMTPKEYRDSVSK